MPVLTIPETLQRFTQGQAEYTLDIQSMNNFKRTVQQQLPELGAVLFEESELNPFVRIAINNKLIDWQENSTIPLTEKDKVELLVAVSGG